MNKDLQGVNLRGAILSNVNLHGMNFQGANLTNADLHGSSEMRFDRPLLYGAIYCNTTMPMENYNGESIGNRDC